MADDSTVPSEKTQPVVTEVPKENPEVAQLRSQLEAQKAATLKAEENWKNEQRNSAKKDVELQKTRDTQSRLDTLEDYVKVLTATVAETKGQTEQEFTADTGARKPQLIQTFEQVSAARKARQEQEALETKVREYQTRTDSLGLDPNSEPYLEVQHLVTTGNFKLADVKLAKMETVKKETEKPKMVEQDLEKEIEKRAEERARKILEEKGLLKTDAGTGASAPARQRVSLSKLPPDEYKKLFPKIGDEFKGIAEGWVDP